MVTILDRTIPPPPLPGEASPDAYLAAITNSLDLASKALGMADRLDATFRTQFPDAYAASKAEDNEDAA